MDEASLESLSAIYIHIPFCKSRCKYCDFYSTTQLGRRKDYIQALRAEMDMRTDEIGDTIPTIYFGGGTPSLLDAEDIISLLSPLRYALPEERMDNIEITLEANPGDLTIEKLKAWRAVGINRLSIGVQSFDDNLLRLIGRRHTAAEAIKAVESARIAGFYNLSIDLMYGLPGQTMSLWKKDIEKALQLRPEHISCYCLSYEDGTPLTHMLDRGEISETDEDTENTMYDILCDKLVENGYIHYEVSNFSLPDRHSRHNSSYWNHTPYVGLGAGAHSLQVKTHSGYTQWIRSWNPSDLDSYIHHSLARSLHRESESLDSDALHTERVMLGLRTLNGISESLVADKSTIIEQYVEQGLLRRNNTQITATQRGLHILNRIIQDLI